MSAPTFPDHLRAYQLDVCHAIDGRRSEGARRCLAVMATGTGKTATAVGYAAGHGGRVLWLAHRTELLDQAAATFNRWWPSASVGIIANTRHEADAHVVIASVQTLRQQNRLDRLVGSFDLVVVDEAHHVRWKADKPTEPCGYRTIIEHLEAGQLLGGPFVLGLTATPDRMDKRSVVDWFDGRLACNLDIAWAIEHGHLCDLTARRIRTEIDLGSVKVKHGDYADGDLGRKLLDVSAPERIVDAWLEHAAERITIAFSPTVEMSQRLAECYRDRGVQAQHVDGATQKDERRAAFDDLRAGRLRVMCTVGIATEGTDIPVASCAVIARPTKSRGLYAQMVGRILRTHPGKDDALVLDVAGASDTNSLILASDLLGLHRALAEHERARDAMRAQEAAAVEEKERTEQQRLLDEEESWATGAVRMTDVDVMGRPRNCKHVWAAAPIDGCADRWTHALDGGGEIVIRRSEPSARVWIAGVNVLGDDGQLHPQLVAKDALISAVITEAERWIDGHRKENSWRGDPATAKQCAYLESLGVDWRTIPRLSKAKAGRLIDEYTKQRKAKADRKAAELARTHTELERITPEAILDAAGRRAMLTGTLAEAESLLGITVATDWRPQAQQRLTATLEVLGDRGALRRQGTSWVIRANERVAS